MNAKVLEAIKKSAAVPSVPQVVTRFLEIMQDPTFDYTDLVTVLSADSGTVSEILRLVNSALFGVRQKIVSLRQALTLLGPKRTRSLLLGRYLVDTMSRRDVAGLDMAYFWRRSLAASVVASRLGHELLPKQKDEVFISALLADIGIPILAEALPEKYGHIVARYTPKGKPFTAEDELEAVEVTHGQVSAMVLAHWTLPEDITTTVNLHQSTQPGQGDVALRARILHASDKIGRMLCKIPNREEVTAVCTEAMDFVGLDMESLARFLPKVETDLEELASVLRIDVIPSNVYALIAKTIQEQLVSMGTSA